MLVETYEVTEETTEGRSAVEIDVAAQALIEELGLEGQKELLVPVEDGETATRIPYQKLTKEEQRVYSTLYPDAKPPESYNSAPIPLRVLQVIAHARTLFDELRIWAPESYDPDPVLVGYIGSTYNGEVFLLARWGDALAPFDELRARASEVVTRKFTAEAEDVIAKCQAMLTNPRPTVEKHIRGDYQNEPWT